ncbi:pyruvate kinase-like isoform X6 [Populus alba x Populus x berolinensis]|nr:pyruvate kinase-like isoform X6 [Populus alba x Populus x berolinensis]
MAGKPAVDTRVVDSMTENLRPTRAEATDVATAILDASYTSESIILLLIAVLIPHSSSLVNKEYVADNESVGDTDSQDAAVSSKKLTELSDDESETRNSQTGLMDVINNVKLTVVDMVTNVSAYYKKIFSFSSAKRTPDAADENAGSSTTEKTLAASLMALAVVVIMVVVLKRP